MTDCGESIVRWNIPALTLHSPANGPSPAPQAAVSYPPSIPGPKFMRRSDVLTLRSARRRLTRERGRLMISPLRAARRARPATAAAATRPPAAAETKPAGRDRWAPGPSQGRSQGPPLLRPGFMDPNAIRYCISPRRKSPLQCPHQAEGPAP